MTDKKTNIEIIRTGLAILRSITPSLEDEEFLRAGRIITQLNNALDEIEAEE